MSYEPRSQTRFDRVDGGSAYFEPLTSRDVEILSLVQDGYTQSGDALDMRAQGGHDLKQARRMPAHIGCGAE